MALGIGNILQSLPQLDPSMMPPWARQNVMQQIIGGSPDAPQPAPVPQASQSAAPAEALRPRRSLLDTVGRISDVLARVGGADALYQPSLDAREDRSNMLEDRTRGIDLDALRRTLVEQQIAAGGDEATGRGNAMLGAAARGLQAIKARGGDIATAWPILARQAGIPEDRAAALSQIFTDNPQAVDAIAAMTGQEKEFGLQPFYAQGSDGVLRAYQLGKDGSVQPVKLGEGETPIDPLKFVDVGGSQVGVGTRSGGVRRILPKTEKPGYRGGQPINERPGFRGGRPIAPAPAKDGGKTAQDQATGVEAAMGNLAEIKQIYSDLNKLGAMVSPKQSTGSNLLARGRASGVGQVLEGAVGTQAQTLRDRVASIRPALMQTIAKATGMTGKQLDSNADVKLFMQTVTDPTASYEANQAAIAGLERFLQTNAKAAPAAAPRQRIQPRGRSTGNSNNGWSVVGVK